MHFLIFLLACAAAAVTGTIFEPGEWYQSLQKPGFTPPNWLFPVAWGTIYLLIAYAGARLAKRPGSQTALALWAAQISLNTLWTPVFFGANLIGAGFAIILILWAVVAALMVISFRLDRLTGALFVPYLIWLTLAAALNGSIWMTNPATPLPAG